eukprot:10653627-Karenia_brevis.AAC.1
MSSYTICQCLTEAAKVSDNSVHSMMGWPLVKKPWHVTPSQIIALKDFLTCLLKAGLTSLQIHGKQLLDGMHGYYDKIDQPQTADIFNSSA